jgi:Tfp pilus tip-associated adhesin PilY1
MSRLPRSTVSRLALVAVSVLDEACQAAILEPVERSVLHKLALGYLMLVEVTNQRQATTFWQLLGHEGAFNQASCRQSFGGTMLDGMLTRAKALGEQGQPRSGF